MRKVSNYIIIFGFVIIIATGVFLWRSGMTPAKVKKAVVELANGVCLLKDSTANIDVRRCADIIKKEIEK